MGVVPLLLLPKRANKQVVHSNNRSYFTNTAKLSHTNNEQLIISKPSSPLAVQAEPEAEALPSILALMLNHYPLARIEHTATSGTP